MTAKSSLAPKKVAVLCGGTSPERQVSLDTGASVLRALLNLGYDATLLDWPEGQIIERCEEIKIFDLVFIGYHGGFGEDGTVQSALELIGVPYTGSGAGACAVSMDKIYSKRIFEQAGIPTPAWFLWEEERAPSVKDALDNCTFGLPMVIKPPSQGSTVGITIAYSEAELERGVELAFQFGKKILFEDYIPGREVTVGILEGEELPVVEIVPKEGFYDYEHKYTSGATEYICPAKIPEETTREIGEMGRRAFQVLGLRHYGRADFRLDGDKPFCLEVNSLPGMTSLSLVPKAAAAVGIDFNRLIGKIVKMADGS
ncbi:MAG TPA: D-alanine--D-alanine ligase [candidate division Zixibacteria bacterium]|nr:D-alanine--D-alanine ligase [candidate division Zixibacteria bacterium]